MDEPLLARVRKQAWFHRYPRGWPLLLFLLIGIGTVLSVVAIERVVAQRRALEFAIVVGDTTSSLQRRAAENSALLRAGAALFATHDQVSRKQFREFVSDIHKNGNFLGAMGMGWAPVLDTKSAAAFDAAMGKIRLWQRPDYRIHPQPRPGDGIAVPIVYLEPSTKANRSAIGFDMYSDPVRRQAMQRSIQLREPVASGKVRYAEERGNSHSSGFIIFMPVFKTVNGQRRIKGFVFAPFHADEFMNSAAKLYRNRGIEVTIYDGAKRPGQAMASQIVPGKERISKDKAIIIGHRKWILHFGIKRHEWLSPVALLTLLFGMTVALLVMFIARLITKRATEDREVLQWMTRQVSIRDSLARELNHRVKNTLANVLSIVSLSRGQSTDIDEFAERITSRVRALSATHDLLSQRDWKDAPISEVLRSELAPYTQEKEGQVRMSGPDVILSPNDALTLGLAIHELATNAAKYGALSTPSGRVLIRWRLLSPELAEVYWREQGGPPVKPPEKSGFGRKLIERIVAHELHSQVDLQFNPGGVECKLQIAVRKTSEFALSQKDSDSASS